MRLAPLCNNSSVWTVECSHIYWEFSPFAPWSTLARNSCSLKEWWPRGFLFLFSPCVYRGYVEIDFFMLVWWESCLPSSPYLPLDDAAVHQARLAAQPPWFTQYPRLFPLCPHLRPTVHLSARHLVSSDSACLLVPVDNHTCSVHRLHLLSSSIKWRTLTLVKGLGHQGGESHVVAGWASHK